MVRRLFSELRAALRGLARHRGSAATAIVTLALGIGSNTAILSAVRGVVFRALPYPESDRLIHVSASWPKGLGNISFPDHAAISERVRSIEKTATYVSRGSVALTGRSMPVNLNPGFVTPEYFDLLGGRAVKGRLFAEADDADASGTAVAVLREGVWEREFGRDARVIGSTIQVNGAPHLVVGVLSRDFRDLGLVEGQAPDIYFPTLLLPSLMGQPPRTEVFRLFWEVARLKPGVTLDAAQAELSGLARQLETERPGTHKGFGLRARTLSNRVRGSFTMPALLLLAGSLFILLIGGANVASLLLVRMTERQSEMALRTSLGASGRDLFIQLFVETVTLCGAGGALGLALGYGLSRLLSVWVASNASSLLDVGLDAQSFAAAIGLAVLAAAGVASFPSRAARDTDLRAGLARGGRTDVAGAGDLTRHVFIATELAFAILLLVGAGLMLRSFERLTTTPLGFDTSRLLTFRMDLAGARYQAGGARSQLVSSFIERATGAPGIESATIWGPSMLGNATWVINVTPEGRPVDRPDAFTPVFRHAINPGGLGNLGIQIVVGRDVEMTDTADRPLVAIVSESAALEMWPNGDALGKQLVRATAGQPKMTVIGIARDARHRQRYSLQDIADSGLIAGLRPQRDIYQPYAQRPNNAVTFGIRVRSGTSGAATSLQAIAASLDPNLALSDMRYLDDRIAAQEQIPKALAGLLVASALLAALLAAVGIYGVVSNSVGRRIREIGLRVALGADRVRILRLVLGRGLAPVAAGALAGIAILATIVPARRALSVDPSVALRAE